MDYLIKQAYSLTGDWGLAILMISMLIRTLFIPINLKQMATIYKQQKLNPQLEKIKKKYEDNKEKMNKKIMELYEKEGVSFGGCFFSILQLPVFLMIYRSISSLTINGGSILIPWAISLGSADPLHILPILYAVVQLVSTLLKNSGNNIMQTLPFLLIILFLWNSPVSLWIYWMVNGVFSLGEGLYFKYAN